MSFKMLIEIFNAIVSVFNKNSFKIYDRENDSYYISGIYYNREEDKIYFDCKEE